MEPLLNDLAIAIGLFCGLFVVLEVGFRLGRRGIRETDAREASQVGVIQGATLGLLGLLLGFSFAAAGSRFLEKQDLIVEEANAIGTAYLRAELLEDAHRDALKSALQRYTEHRLAIAEGLRQGLPEGATAAFEQFHQEIWQAARDGVAARPAAMLGVLPPVNDVIDLHATRFAAASKHLPLPVLALLVACSILAMAELGYGCGLSGSRRAPLTLSLAALVGTALWITIDLDHPRAGLLRLNDAPLRALRFDGTP